MEPLASVKTPQKKVRSLITFDPRLAGFNLQLLLRQKGLFTIHRAVASQEMVREKYVKVRKKSGNFVLNQEKLTFLKERSDIKGYKNRLGFCDHNDQSLSNEEENFLRKVDHSYRTSTRGIDSCKFILHPTLCS